MPASAHEMTMPLSVRPVVSRSGVSRSGVSRLGVAGQGICGCLPGVALCIAVMLAAMALERAEAFAFGAKWLEALVLAILVGTAVRTVWTPGQIWSPGIAFSAKTLLEIAVVLLGASVSAATVMACAFRRLQPSIPIETSH